MRHGSSKMGHNIGFVYDDIISSVRKSGGIPIMISDDNLYDYLEICRGFIFQGGDDISKNNLDILKILRDKNMPVLGICLGMQEMGTLYGGKLIDITGHNGIKHKVNIPKDSLLYKILEKDEIVVNSRHKSVITFPKIKVGAIAYDNIIEAIYDDELTFFLGVQWHPENMYDDDINAKKIFDYFVKMCNDKACK